MEPADFAQISREAVFVLMMVSTPILLISLFVGLIISLLQALTQIQENTLTFVPKMLVVYISLLFIGPFIMGKLEGFTQKIADLIISGS
ncbi:MAG: fliQ [Rickettsiaceae bacterium]|jgi:flagellar biosynthetic protein FliQ|nr:fliQ [Rickettsiaceae bacterium]